LKSKIFPLLVFAAVSCTAVAPAAENANDQVAPGLRHLVIGRGEVATGKSYRILLGTFESQSEADRLIQRMRENGFAAGPTADGTRYRVVTPGLPDLTEAEDLKARLIDLGFAPPLEIQEIGQDLTHDNGPWMIHVLEADPKLIEIRVAHAYDAAIGLETTADLAERHGALAAINGGFFLMTGLLAGDSQGTLVMDGRVLSEPDRGRATVGFYSADGSTRAVVGRLSFRGEVRFGDGIAVPIDGVNRARQASEIVLFTPEFHRTTLTPPGGVEVIVENGRIADFRDGGGSSIIPPSGMVVSIGSDRFEQIRPHVRPGAPVAVATKLISLLPDPEGEWERAEGIASAGPLLLWNGKRIEEPEKESISNVFCLARHPRTAAGVRADGTLVFVTVDGRQPETSVGMSIPELTDLMLELGCVSAMNLDGGGSTTMVVNGQIVNSPSGSSPRRNADAILLFPASPGTPSY
jgi:exopolysaccharide biosynthesis protein